MERLTSELDHPRLIVTTAAAGERAGCLVGFHSQCSIHPLRWAVWISKTNYTYRVAVRASVLAMHFPLQGDDDIAHLFGEETGDDVDKFARCAWTEGAGGVPLLDRLPNRLVGRIRDVIDDGGDHQLFAVDIDETNQGVGPLRTLGYQSVRGFDPGHPA